MGVIQRASGAGVVLVVALSCWGCGAGTWKAPPINGEFLVPEPIPGEEKDTTDEFFGDDDDAAPDTSGQDGAAPTGDAKPAPADAPAADAPAPAPGAETPAGNTGTNAQPGGSK